MVGPYMLLLCLYSSHLIIASAHNDLCLILNHIQIIKNFLGYMSTMHRSFILFFENAYLTLNILKTIICRTSTMAYLFWYMYIYMEHL